MRTEHNWSTSSWWFFVLLPEQNTGYGPKQMMFTFASRVGKILRVSPNLSKVTNKWQSGIDGNHSVALGKDQFWTTVVGWINDGSEVHEEIVHEPALVHLQKGKIAAWNQYGENKHGGEIEELAEHHLKAHFEGANGYAKFEVWADSEWDVDGPQIRDIKVKQGSVNLIAWRKLKFAGSFKSPAGEEELHGLGYFQRVVMNIPMFPWYWNYTLFEDGSIFSLFAPYLGLQVLRRSDKFFPAGIERLIKPFMATAYFADNTSKKTIEFDKIKIHTEVQGQALPKFVIECKNTNTGDYIKSVASAHGRAQFILDRKIFLNFLHSRFNYNEFMIKLDTIEGQLHSAPFDIEKYGQGWGNMEYTWGISL